MLFQMLPLERLEECFNTLGIIGAELKSGKSVWWQLVQLAAEVLEVE